MSFNVWPFLMTEFKLIFYRNIIEMMLYYILASYQVGLAFSLSHYWWYSVWSLDYSCVGQVSPLVIFLEIFFFIINKYLWDDTFILCIYPLLYSTFSPFYLLGYSPFLSLLTWCSNYPRYGLFILSIMWDENIFLWYQIFLLFFSVSSRNKKNLCLKYAYEVLLTS